MEKLIIAALLAVCFEVVFPLPLITNENDPSKPLQQYSAPRRLFSRSRQPTLTRQGSKSRYDIDLIQLEPRSVIADIFSSPIQSLVSYLMNGLYALSDPFRYQQNANVASAVQKPTTTFNLTQPANISPKNTRKSNSATKKKSNATPQTNFKGSLFFNSSGQLMNLGNSSTEEQPINSNVAPDIPVQQPGKTVTVEGKNGKILVNGQVKYYNDETFKNDREVHIRIQGGNFYVNDNLVLKKGRSDHEKVIQSTHNLDYYGITSFVWVIYSDGNMEYEDNKSGRLRINYYTPIEFGESSIHYETDS